MSQDIVLFMKNITKNFPGVRALDDVSIEVRKGEIVALLGENGAGKSTLIKVLSGVYQHDDGQIILEGHEVPAKYSPKLAKELGVATIYQELSVMNELSVAENILMCNEPLRNRAVRIIDYKKMRQTARDVLGRVKASYIDVGTKVKKLSAAERQIVEISKALIVNCKVLILDEPTTSLTEDETQNLFEVIKELKKQDISIIYISHRMDEIRQIADRAIVMRDGKIAGESNIAGWSKNAIVEMLTGHKWVREEEKEESNCLGKKEVLRLENISNGRLIRDVSMSLYENEVLGISGLLGSQRTELFRIAAGIDRKKSGNVYVNEKCVNIKSPRDALAYGVGYLSENRKEDGLNLGLKIGANIVLTKLSGISRYSVVSKKKTDSVYKKYSEKLHIKGTDQQKVLNLSGGNQQKVSIAKWLFADCNILIFDEPTRGIDVSAKKEIHDIIKEFVRDTGKAAIVISSDVEEIVEVSSRVLVMSKGHITHEIVGNQIKQDYILKCNVSEEVG